jgi:hypothetical protein
MIEVESSTIKKIGYSYPDKKLIVEFKSGGIYHYKEVPEEIFEELKTCESIGKFLNENIKKKYEFEAVYLPGRREDSEGSELESSPKL